MIKLFSLKEKQKQDAAASTKGPKQSAGELRLQKDMSELKLDKTTSINFPEGKDKLLHFEITICPDSGIYRHGHFLFDFNVPTGYPHDPPKVKCKTKVYHPNIDPNGNVCLNILREDWKPVLSISSVIYGLQFLFMDPNPEDPLNKEAAELLLQNRNQFEQTIQRHILRGQHIGNTYWPPCAS